MSEDHGSNSGAGRGGQASSNAADERRASETKVPAAPTLTGVPDKVEPTPEPVPSLYRGPDPEFDRPIFRRHKDTPPAGPTGTIIRKPPAPPSRPAAVERPSAPSRPEFRPEPRSESRPEFKPESRPETRPEPTPEARPDRRPVVDARTMDRPSTASASHVPPSTPRREAGSEVRFQARPENSARIARLPSPGSPLPLKKIETGIMALDHRIGGFSVGSLNSLSGVDHGSRSHLAVHMAGTVIEQGGRVLAMISPTEEGYWEPRPGLYIDVAVRRDLDGLVNTIEGAGKVDLVIFDPLHTLDTPPQQDRIASMDHAFGQLAGYLRRYRTTFLAVSHMVDRAARHQGVSLHPWMFRDVTCLLDVSEVVLILRESKSGGREILVYRRGINNRVGGLPSFVLPWV